MTKQRNPEYAAAVALLEQADADRVAAGLKPFTPNERKLAITYYVEGTKFKPGKEPPPVAKKKATPQPETPYRIHRGNCQGIFPNYGTNGHEFVDLAIIDPPYNIGYEYDRHKDDMTAEEYRFWCNQWIGDCARALKPDGAMWLIIGDEWAADLQIIARSRGLHLRNWVIWHYTFGQHMKTKFTRSHAHCLHFVKNPKKHVFNFSDVAVPSARTLVYGDKRAAKEGRCPDDVWILRPQWFPEGFTAQHDTWFIPRLCGTFKEKAKTPNQLPEQLVARMIAVSSNPGDVVLDPMCGSGTVPAVAKKLGRKPMGFELSADYAKAAQKRLDAVKEGDAIS